MFFFWEKETNTHVQTDMRREITVCVATSFFLKDFILFYSIVSIK